MINPVLAEMAVYPFTRLEEERRRLLARRRRRDRLRQGRSERADRPDDPAGTRRCAAGTSAVSPRAGAARAARSGVRLARAALRRRGRPRHGDRAHLRLEGGDLLARAGARNPRARGGVRRAGVPGLRARRALRRSPGADAAAAPRERLPARSRGARRRRRARLGQLSAQPDRRGRAARVLRRARGGGGAPRLRRRLGRGVHGALVRRAAAVGAPGGRPLAHRRLPDAEQALVDDRLPLRVRRRRRPRSSRR